jgi:L-fucose mutarotase
MLKGIDKILTGDLLKILCDMGHGDEIVIGDANFPAETCAKRLVRLPGTDAVSVAKAIMSVIPLDTYSENPAIVMNITDSDKAKGMKRPEIFGEYEKAIGHEVSGIERFAFYERAKKAYAVIQSGETRIYGNIIIVKGVVI